MQERDWQTVAINYREHLFWTLVLVQLIVLSVIIIPNPGLAKWAKNLLGPWYYHDFIWMIISALGLGCILIISKALERLVFLNLEQ